MSLGDPYSVLFFTGPTKHVVEPTPYPWRVAVDVIRMEVTMFETCSLKRLIFALIAAAVLLLRHSLRMRPSKPSSLSTALLPMGPDGSP